MQWLTEYSNFTSQRISDRGSCIGKERCRSALVFMCGMRRVFESEEERSCRDGE